MKQDEMTKLITELLGPGSGIDPAAGSLAVQVVAIVANAGAGLVRLPDGGTAFARVLGLLAGLLEGDQLEEFSRVAPQSRGVLDGQIARAADRELN